MAEAFRDPWSYEEAVQEWAGAENHDPTLWLVALDGEETVGALFGTMSDGRGQVTALGVRDAWRRCGIGRGLLRASFAMFRDRAVNEVRLNVDRANTSGATHLYEQAGMHLRRRWLMVAKTMVATQDPPRTGS